MEAILKSENLFVYCVKINKDLKYSLQKLHISNRVVQCPLPYAVKIPAHMLRIELRPRLWISFDHVQREKTNVRIALDIQPENLDAVICYEFKRCVSVSH
jgi:hypothetical protein